MTKELVFVTVIGEDQKGIIAKMSDSVYEKDINIEDISQKVIEGYFVMNMLIDIKESTHDLNEIEKDLKKIGEEMNLQVELKHEKIFKAMQRV